MRRGLNCGICNPKIKHARRTADINLKENIRRCSESGGVARRVSGWLLSRPVLRGGAPLGMEGGERSGACGEREKETAMSVVREVLLVLTCAALCGCMTPEGDFKLDLEQAAFVAQVGFQGAGL